MIISVSAEVNIPKETLKKIVAKSSLTLATRLSLAKKSIRLQVQSLIREYLERSKILKSLRGQNGPGILSLRGEIGLSPEDAMAAADRIITIVEKVVQSPKIQRQSSGDGTNINISMETLSQSGESDYQKKLIYDEALRYISPKSGVLIDWMAWLIFGIGINTNYAIIYPSNIEDFDSRSGQAIMVRANRKTRRMKGFRHPYDFPSAFLPKGNAQDFVQEALGEKFQNAVLKLITDLVMKSLKEPTATLQKSYDVANE